MPIGNLTSQFFANVYLNELDYFVKHVLRAKYYIRYVDDFALLETDRDTLIKHKERIEEFLKTLKIELHPNKSKIYPLHKGIDFLGFRMFYYYRLICKKNIRKMKAKLERMERLCKEEKISPDDITKSVDGWSAYAMWGDTYKLRQQIKKLF